MCKLDISLNSTKTPESEYKLVLKIIAIARMRIIPISNSTNGEKAPFPL